MIVWWLVSTLIGETIPLHFGTGGTVIRLYSDTLNSRITLFLYMELVSRPSPYTVIHWLQIETSVETLHGGMSPLNEWEMLYVIPEKHPLRLRTRQGEPDSLVIAFPRSVLVIPLKPLGIHTLAFPWIWRSHADELPQPMRCSEKILEILQMFYDVEALCKRVETEKDQIRKRYEKTRKNLDLYLINARPAWRIYALSWYPEKNPITRKKAILVVRDDRKGVWEVPWEAGVVDYPAAFLRGDTLILQALVKRNRNATTQPVLEGYVLTPGHTVQKIVHSSKSRMILTVDGDSLPETSFPVLQVAPMMDTRGAYALVHTNNGKRILRVVGLSPEVHNVHWMITDFGMFQDLKDITLTVGDEQGVWGVTSSGVVWRMNAGARYSRGMTAWQEACKDIVGTRAGSRWGGILWVCQDGSLWSITFRNGEIQARAHSHLQERGCRVHKTFLSGVVARCGKRNPVMKTFQVYGITGSPIVKIKETFSWKDPEMWIFPFFVPVLVPARGVRVSCTSSKIWDTGGTQILAQIFADPAHRYMGFLFRPPENRPGTLCLWDLQSGEVYREDNVHQVVPGFSDDVWVVYADGSVRWYGGGM